MFHYGDPFLRLQDSGHTVRLAAAHVVCLRGTTASLSPGALTGFISVRFRAGAVRHFCAVPACHFVDSLEDATHYFGREIHALSARIAEAGTFATRVALLEAWLLRRLAEQIAVDTAVDAAVRRLYYGYAHTRLDDVAGRLGIGPRQFQRRFTSAMGMGPKEFIRLSRFQHAARALLLADVQEPRKAALPDGYYDQSHFIREFKSFTGQTPSAFLASGARMSHFYNTSRPENAILSSAEFI